MDKTVEMEMKLTIARRDLKKLLASELITATMIKGSLAKQELLTTYYDTASYKLTESGMAYRIRRNGKKCTCRLFRPACRTGKRNDNRLGAGFGI